MSFISQSSAFASTERGVERACVRLSLPVWLAAWFFLGGGGAGRAGLSALRGAVVSPALRRRRGCECHFTKAACVELCKQ